MAPVLGCWDLKAPIIIETDASNFTLAAIIFTYQEGELYPIAFHSRTFQAAELNYDIYDKELLAIFEVFKRWRHYLKGTPLPVEVITDHRNLEYFCKTKALTQRQACWSEYLFYFNLKIHFRPGRLGTKPDSLTRRWDLNPRKNMNYPTTQVTTST